MDAVLVATTIAAVALGVLSIWAHFRGRRRGFVDLSYLYTFSATLIILGLLLMGVPWYIAVPLVFVAGVVDIRIRRRRWTRTLESHERQE